MGNPIAEAMLEMGRWRPEDGPLEAAVEAAAAEGMDLLSPPVAMMKCGTFPAEHIDVERDLNQFSPGLSSYCLLCV